MLPKFIYTTFPFLIGKVLTKDLIAEKVDPYLNAEPFPFLIGKVLTKTIDQKPRYKRTVVFPFLIGKVLTNRNHVDSPNRGEKVSIPYR